MTLVILSGLPLIMHMVRAASLSAGSKDSVKVRERGREKEMKEGDGGEEGGRERGERGKRKERGRGEKAGKTNCKVYPVGVYWSTWCPVMPI